MPRIKVYPVDETNFGGGGFIAYRASNGDEIARGNTISEVGKKAFAAAPECTTLRLYLQRKDHRDNHHREYYRRELKFMTASELPEEPVREYFVGYPGPKDTILYRLQTLSKYGDTGYLPAKFVRRADAEEYLREWVCLNPNRPRPVVIERLVPTLPSFRPKAYACHYADDAPNRRGGLLGEWRST